MLYGYQREKEKMKWKDTLFVLYIYIYIWYMVCSDNNRLEHQGSLPAYCWEGQKNIDFRETEHPNFYSNWEQIISGHQCNTLTIQTFWIYTLRGN
jgi:hypothetical protein